MIINNVGMLIVSSPRSQAYLQKLVAENLIPSHVIIMEDKKVSPGQLKKKIRSSNEYFDLNEDIMQTIKDNNISFEICPTKDINSETVIKILKKRPEKYFIYSGSGGAILKEDILNCGKKFLHVHPGSLPGYRGSTTVYYSILKENKCFASAFFLEKRIDAGGVIKMKEYAPPKDRTIIDYEYDPYIRADLLVSVIKDYLKIGEFPDIPIQKDEGETYFIIHPVLKHIAILGKN
ncbi:MAG: hypothetical protein JSW73_04355 [Candidatus Woesearchaeota archaeon]|nr:MAG: hypothetical protein JSW73_04355 [Candidatus Woesearchaeota archaeon]